MTSLKQVGLKLVILLLKKLEITGLCLQAMENTPFQISFSNSSLAHAPPWLISLPFNCTQRYSEQSCRPCPPLSLEQSSSRKERALFWDPFYPEIPFPSASNHPIV